MCPEDTIPIRRTKEDDVLRASSVKRYGKKKHKSIHKSAPDLVNESGHQHAIAYVEGDKFYGVKATMNVWEPKIQQPNEFSLSQIWILGGSFGEDLNSIEAGWLVPLQYIIYYLCKDIRQHIEIIFISAFPLSCNAFDLIP